MAARRLLMTVWIGLLAAGLQASRPAYWQADTYDELSEGRVAGLAVTYDGRLVLAPEFREVADSGQPYILCAAADDRGNVFYGTGHEGKVFRLDSQGKAVEIFDAEEPDIFALAVNSEGVVFAAAGPGGKVYRIDRDGTNRLLVDLKCRYVWALLSARDGALFAGTGVEGKIFRIQNDQSEVYYDSSQMHVMCLAQDLSGNLLAGTAPNGYVLRIASDGKGSALYDAPLAEIHQLQTDRYGRVFALGIGREAEDTKASADASADTIAALFQKEESPKTKRSKKDSGGADAVVLAGPTAATVSALYRLDKDLSVRTLWSSSQTRAFSFQVAADGGILLGTDDRGRVLSLQEDRVLAVLAESEQEQVTVLLAQQPGTLVFTSGLGKLYRLGVSPAASGEYLSDIVDADCPAQFGILQAVLSAPPAGMTVELYFRCGNTALPDEAWTDWSGPFPPAGGKAPVPAARYGQIRVVLRRSSESPTGTGFGIEGLSLAYQQRNLTPELLTLTVNPPGVIYQKQPVMMPQGEMPEYGEHSSLVLPDYIQASLTKLAGGVQQPKIYRPGTLSLAWTDRDPNDDTLEYAIHFRPVDATGWTLLADGLRQNWFNIGRNQLGDGKYLFKVVASDAPSNPPGQAREDYRISQVVTLDSNPPRLKTVDSRKTTNGWEMTIEVADDLSPVYMVEFSRDGGETWNVLPPEDGICDQLQERCRLAVPALAPDVRLLLVRAMDYNGNLAVFAPQLPQ
jgi:outer membrane protein assembly factor BamB